jgi:hypothetical protein
MKSIRVITMALAAALALAGADSEPVTFYKLDFTVKEMEAGKTLDSHSYSVRIPAIGMPASIRAGNKIPLVAPNGTDFTYLEVGTNFDLRHFKEVAGEVSVEVAAEVSGIPSGTEKSSKPIIRQNKWNSTVSARLGKPTMIFSSDDQSSKRQTVVEMTATPVR